MTCDQTVSSSDAICECLPASSIGASASTISQAKLSSGLANDSDVENANTDGVA